MRTFASLRRRADFARLRRHGGRVTSALITVYQAKAANGQPLVGISTSRNVGGAVTRNRIRRRILSVLDEISRGGALPGRLLVEARPAAADADFAQLRNELRKAVQAPQ